MNKFSFLRSILVEDPDSNDIDVDSAANEQLIKFVTSIKEAKDGTIRYVIRMHPDKLSVQYLKSGGGGDFVKQLTDEEVLDIAQNSEQGKIFDKNEVQFLRPGYTFKQLITSQNVAHKTAILLDIPEIISNELLNSKMDVSAARAALMRMMNHKYYVMSINTVLAAKIQSAVEPNWNNVEKLTQIMNPAIVRNMPSNQELVYLKNLWIENHGSLEVIQTAPPPKVPDTDTKPDTKPEANPEPSHAEIVQDEDQVILDKLKVAISKKGPDAQKLRKELVSYMRDNGMIS